jgi:ribosomal protein S18 acetylase RimI-like enzyme
VERGGLASQAGPVRVRRATDADLPALRALWQEYSAEVAGFRRTPWTWTWDDARARLPQGAGFLAESGDELIGFAIASRSRPDIGHLEDLYVRPAHRRRGVAMTMLHNLVRVFAERGVTFVALDVDADNWVARRLYERAGFVRYADRFAAEVDVLNRRRG